MHYTPFINPSTTMIYRLICLPVYEQPCWVSIRWCLVYLWLSFSHWLVGSLIAGFVTVFLVLGLVTLFSFPLLMTGLGKWAETLSKVPRKNKILTFILVSIQLSLLCRRVFFILRICGKICIFIKKESSRMKSLLKYLFKGYLWNFSRAVFKLYVFWCVSL